MNQMKYLVSAAVGILGLMCIFALAASNGGSWSTGRSSYEYANGTIYVDFTFGLTEYRVRDGLTMDRTLKYAELKVHSVPMNLKIDFEDLDNAGTWTVVFLVLGVIFLVLTIAQHLMMWPCRCCFIFQKKTLHMTFLSTFFFLLCFLMWETMGSRAAHHVIVDSYLLAPEREQIHYGWCYKLIGCTWAFTVFTTILAWKSLKLSAEAPESYSHEDYLGDKFQRGGL